MRGKSEKDSQKKRTARRGQQERKDWDSQNGSVNGPARMGQAEKDR
jgi:hypothetical protein